MLCTKFGWNWRGGSGEEVEKVNLLQADGPTDGRTAGRSDDQYLTWAFSSGEVKNLIIRAMNGKQSTRFKHVTFLRVMKYFFINRLRRENASSFLSKEPLTLPVTKYAKIL